MFCIEVFKQVLDVYSFSRRVTSTGSFIFPSRCLCQTVPNMTSTESAFLQFLASIQTIVIPVSSTFLDLSHNPTSVIDARLSDLKRSLSDELEVSVSSAVKRVTRSEIEFRSKGNKKQFAHQHQVLDSLTEARDSMANAKYKKAKDTIEEGIELTEKRLYESH